LNKCADSFYFEQHNITITQKLNIIMWLYYILLPVTLYIIGSIPFGVLISQGVARIDIIRKGSGNTGATNVARELGIKWGFLTLVMDLLKGFSLSLYAPVLFPTLGLDCKSWD